MFELLIVALIVVVYAVFAWTQAHPPCPRCGLKRRRIYSDVHGSPQKEYEMTCTGCGHSERFTHHQLS